MSCDGTARLWDCGSGQCITSITSIQCPINKCSLFTNNNISNTQIQPPLHGKCVCVCMYVCVCVCMYV